MKKIYVLITMLLVSCLSGFGQSKKLYGMRWDGTTEWYGSIDFSTGSFTALNSLPGVRGIAQGMSTSDLVHGRFFFEGSDTYSETYFYWLDIKTGKMLGKNHLSSTSPLTEIQYDAKSNKFYGLQYYGGKEWFASLDTATDSVTRIDTISGVNGIAQSICGFDSTNGKYYFRASTSTGEYYFIINASNGHVVYQIAVDSSRPLSLLHFDEVRSTFYGIGWDGSHEFIGTLSTSGTVTEIDSIEGVYALAQGIYDYDSKNGIFYFLGDKRDGTNYIYGIDVKAGSVKSQTANTTTNATLFNVYALSSANASTLKGTVFTSTGGKLRMSKVYLCTYDAADTIVNVIDSTMTDSLGKYSFLTVDSAVYLMAMPSMYYPTQMPTWSDSGLYFTDANVINISSGTNTKNFSTLFGSNPGGGGFIGGKVSYCTICKMAAPVAGLRIILADKNGVPQAYTYTDKNGNFSFKKIAIKDYKIFVDRPKIDNGKAPMLSLTSSASSLSNLTFTLYPDHLGQDNVTSSVENIQQGISEMQIYPNPFTGNTNIKLNLNKASQIKVILTDITGREVYNFSSNQPEGIFNHSIDGSQLVPGMYILQVRNGNEVKIVKLAKD